MVNMLRGQKEHKDEGLETEELKDRVVKSGRQVRRS